jgi:hypothetical protein
MKNVSISEVAVKVTKTYIITLRVDADLINDKDHLIEEADHHINDAAEEFEMSPLSLADKHEIEVVEVLDEWNDYEDL